jgi:hypothetical protein
MLNGCGRASLECKEMRDPSFRDRGRQGRDFGVGRARRQPLCGNHVGRDPAHQRWFPGALKIDQGHRLRMWPRSGTFANSGTFPNSRSSLYLRQGNWKWLARGRQFIFETRGWRPRFDESRCLCFQLYNYASRAVNRLRLRRCQLSERAIFLSVNSFTCAGRGLGYQHCNWAH